MPHFDSGMFNILYIQIRCVFMHGVYQEIYVKNNETTITAVFWFLCVANVYIDPVKKTPIFLTNQVEMLMDTPYLYT